MRGVTSRSAVAWVFASTLAVAALVTGFASVGQLAGPVLTLAIVGAYLAAWGYRSMALLRTTSLLSLLTWAPIADAVHDIVRASLDQPSERIYRRLADLGAFGIDDTPWRLFSALLHRGALVVIATFVLCLAFERWSLSGRNIVDVALTGGGALVVHHAVILASPIDAYRPSTMEGLATNPSLEIALAAAAVVILELVRRRRALRVEAAVTAIATPSTSIERDPVIFSPGSLVTSRTVQLLLLSGLVPLMLLVLAR
jgi:hypothetical protein